MPETEVRYSDMIDRKRQEFPTVPVLFHEQRGAHQTCYCEKAQRRYEAMQLSVTFHLRPSVIHPPLRLLIDL